MYPLLFELGPLSIYSYGLLLATAYIVGLRFALRRADRAGLNGERVMDLGIFVIISALLGAKLMLLVVDFDQFTSDPSRVWVLLNAFSFLCAVYESASGGHPREGSDQA